MHSIVRPRKEVQMDSSGGFSKEWQLRVEWQVKNQMQTQQRNGGCCEEDNNNNNNKQTNKQKSCGSLIAK